MAACTKILTLGYTPFRRCATVSEHTKAAVAAIQQNLAAMLRRERQQLRLTQAEVARVAGVSRPTVIAAEAGQGISSQNLVAIMAALGITFARQTAQPVEMRPRLKALMQAERERQARLRTRRSEDKLAGATFAFQAAPDTARPAASAPPRPRLKDLMAQERARLAQRPRG
jgi:transcriptional regulator with XRE-family HTH domain